MKTTFFIHFDILSFTKTFFLFYFILSLYKQYIYIYIYIYTESKHRAFRKGNRKVPQIDGHSGIEDLDSVIFEQCETHALLKERETFWQHRVKTFYPTGLKEKEEHFY